MASLVENMSAVGNRASAVFRRPVGRPRRDPQHADTTLAMLVEGEIIPRLMRSSGIAPSEAGTGHRANDEAVADIVSFALAADVDALFERVQAMLGGGATVERLLVDLLAPAARRLGVLWEDDRCDFVEVTMGLWRLQEVVREISAHVPPSRQTPDRQRSALFAALPGDQHSFGAVLIEEAFRRAGWASDLAMAPTMSELLGQVGGASYDLVGLTVSCDCHIARLPSIITTLRSVSANPGLCIMVGGRVFVEDPELAGHVGADGTAPDAVSAVALANELIVMRAGEVIAFS